MGSDHYGAMELSNNLNVATHKKPWGHRGCWARQTGLGYPAGDKVRGTANQFRVIKIPRLWFSKRGTGEVGALNRVGCAPAPQKMNRLLAEYLCTISHTKCPCRCVRKPSGLRPTEGKQP